MTATQRRAITQCIRMIEADCSQLDKLNRKPDTYSVYKLLQSIENNAGYARLQIRNALDKSEKEMRAMCGECGDTGYVPSTCVRGMKARCPECQS